MTESEPEVPLRSLGPLGPWLFCTETPATRERRISSAPAIVHSGEMDEPITLQCPFTGCENVMTHASEAVAVAVFNAHIATHTMASAPAAKRSRTEMKKPCL